LAVARWRIRNHEAAFEIFGGGLDDDSGIFPVMGKSIKGDFVDFCRRRRAPVSQFERMVTFDE
jgi:hypothetical protein